MNVAEVEKLEIRTAHTKFPVIVASVPGIAKHLAKCPDDLRDRVAYDILNLGLGKREMAGRIREANEAVGRIAELYGADWGWRIALGNRDVRGVFVREPDAVADAFSRIKAIGGRYADTLLGQLDNDDMGKFFAQKTSTALGAFEEMAGISPASFYAMYSPKVRRMLCESMESRNNLNCGLAEILSRHPKPGVFLSLQNADVSAKFRDYCEGGADYEALDLYLTTGSTIAIELGRPLDDLHEDKPKRMGYLAKLSTDQVFALLCSNPEYFYTSSNHMLFDRLKKDLGGKSVLGLFEKYGMLETEQCRNFLFRAITYDRLYGKEDSLFSEKDVGAVMDSLLSPLESKTFDKTYFFLLANSMDSLGTVEDIRGRIRAVVEGRLEQLKREGSQDNGERSVCAALEFLCFQYAPETKLVPVKNKVKMYRLNQNLSFRRERYCVDGKLRVVQIFDRKDTEKDHWSMTQSWFGGLGKRRVGESGEIIYENDAARMVLFMGKSDSENRGFIQKQLAENPNMVISFRGHSYSLQRSFPFSIFGNLKGEVLFIPGSCGSSSSIPEYMANNKKTNILFFSYTSTGKGQVTNAIIDAIIRTNENKPFSEILSENQRKIEANGGDLSTIRAWSPGEALLKYVYSE